MHILTQYSFVKNFLSTIGNFLIAEKHNRFLKRHNSLRTTICTNANAQQLYCNRVLKLNRCLCRSLISILKMDRATNAQRATGDVLLADIMKAD